MDATLLADCPPPLQHKSSRMAWHAAREALAQSGIERAQVALALCAAIGWSSPAAELLETNLSNKEKQSHWQQDPAYAASQPGESARQLHQLLNCTGPLLTDHAACAAGLHSVIHAARLIRSGRVQACLAGAADSRVSPTGIISYARLGVLNTADNDTPARASRPFNTDRQGFIIGEGAGFLVLESLDHAIQRGAVILGELAGWALSNDADDLTDPLADGSGAMHCIRQCLDQAGMTAREVDYINAHGTSTINNDRMEALAYRSLWQPGASPAISSTKSMIGHLSMASAAVESVITLGALQQGILPPTLNLTDPDPVTAGLNLVGITPEKRPIQVALKTAFGLGGQNAAVLWKKWSP